MRSPLYRTWFRKLPATYRLAITQAVEHLGQVHAAAEAERAKHRIPQWLDRMAGRTDAEQSVARAIRRLPAEAFESAKICVVRTGGGHVTLDEALHEMSVVTGLSAVELEPLERAIVELRGIRRDEG